MNRSRKPYVRYGFLALFFLVSATYRALDIKERVDELRHGHELARPPFDVDLPHYVVLDVEEEAARVGLAPGHQITSINNRPLNFTAMDLWVPLRAARAGDQMAVGSTRAADGKNVPVSTAIVLQPMRRGSPSATDVATFAVVAVLLPIFCTVLGFWVAAVRVTDLRAWLLLFVLLGMAEFTGNNPRVLFGRQDLFQPIASAYQPVLANFWATAMLVFAIYFPERLALDRRLPWLKWLLIAPIAVRVVGDNVVAVNLAQWNPRAGMAVHAFIVDGALAPMGRYTIATYPLFLVAFLVIMIWRTLTERAPDARRRLLLLDAGAALGLTPVLIFLAFFVAGRRDIVVQWLTNPVIACLFAGLMLVFPLTLAYVIVVHRAMEIRVVVRQGVQYVLARGGIRVIQLVLIVVAAIAATSLLSGSAGSVRVAVVVAGLAAIVAIGGRFADRLRAWVDRRFFREAYDAEQILSDLATQVQTMVETRPLLQTVAHRIAETLHVPEVAVLLNEGGHLRPAYAVGYGDVTQVALPDDGVTMRRLRRDAHARVRFDDPDSWVHDATESERAALTALRPDVLLPLSLNQKVLGLLSLGRKRSEEPYSSSDLRMLGSVATQTGLALENSRLTAEITAQIAEREKRRRELEIAREVQQRLFPQTYPAVPGLDYAGQCRPALEVGGDYYDFVTMSPTELGLAIGDVSGKGIPAALLMATLRAFLRGQTIGGDRDLARMMVNLNALVYESSATNRYATFFFGRYDSATRVFDYVNAGHNPPMVFRACGLEGPEVVRLGAGGPVIGLLPICGYEQGTVTLKEGDLLVAFTDGISEAMSAAEEEFGEERLVATVGEGLSFQPAALIRHIMAATDAFAGDTPQYDDMTLVVARCT